MGEETLSRYALYMATLGNRPDLFTASFLPLQSGVGNIANAVLGALGRDKTIPAFEMYTEVLQDAVVDVYKRQEHTKDQCLKPFHSLNKN